MAGSWGSMLETTEQIQHTLSGGGHIKQFAFNTTNKNVSKPPSDETHISIHIHTLGVSELKISAGKSSIMETYKMPLYCSCGPIQEQATVIKFDKKCQHVVGQNIQHYLLSDMFIFTRVRE